MSGVRPSIRHAAKVRFLGLAILLLAGMCEARATFTFRYEPHALGSVDFWGYGFWSVPLATVVLDGTPVPLRADFTTDPRPAPTASPLGRGWSIPFFASYLVETPRGSLRWQRPDGRIFYFVRERGKTGGQTPRPGDLVNYVGTSGDWKAVKDGKAKRCVLTHIETGAEVVYEDGLMTRISLENPKQGGKTYTLTYNNLRRPLRLAVLGSGQVLAEFVYDSASRAKELHMGDAHDASAQVFTFEYADASLNRFSGGPFLGKITKMGEPSVASASEAKGAVSLIPLAITYQTEGAAANRVRFERLVKDGGSTGLVWDARSGFLKQDDSATYKIENPSLADGGRSTVKTGGKLADYNWAPDYPQVTRTDRDGKSEFRHYDKDRGILTVTNKEGVTTKKYYLMTLGVLMNKLRKVEEIRNGKVTTLERNAYDENGNMIRMIDQLGNCRIWEYNNDSSLSRKYFNNNLESEYFYNEGKLVRQIEYIRQGTREQFVRYIGDKKMVVSMLNGVFEWEKTYDLHYGLIQMRNESGVQTWTPSM